jgi:predicted ATPase/class 3 adenylate cyclase
MAACGRCGEENPGRARFCLACGTELTQSGSETRKTVTVLFADMVDSTGLGERLDPEALRDVMSRYFESAEAAIKAHGGNVEKFIGDAIMAVFGIPQVHEDDALRALRAAEEIQLRIIALNEARPEAEPISVRVGINTGEVIAGTGSHGRADVIGDVINAAARLEKHAPPGGIVIGNATHRLVRDSVTSETLGPIMLKGKEAPLEAHMVVAVQPASADMRTFGAPMVGRVREMETLERAFERVVNDRVCTLFTLLGVAGIGKSRMLAELPRRASTSPRVLTGRCLPYGDGITFWPITEVMTEAAHISDRDPPETALLKLTALVEGAEDAKVIANLVSQLLGLGEVTASQEEIFWAVRKTFEALAASGPLVVVFDDIHWAEPTFLDMIDHLVESIGDVPLLVVCLARPELLESRPTWGGGKLNAATMLIEPLREEESRELFTSMLGATASIEPLLPRILEVSEGNPFFLEETIAMLTDEGVIEQVDGTWVARGDIERIHIPPTINALLTARLDQLSPDERTAIELASVMGKVFASQAVRDLTGGEIDIADTLEMLSRKGLLRLDQEEFAGEEMYRFRHILIRDAAYQGIPKVRRGDVHQRYAVWLIDVLAERVIEYDEIIGYHFERAYEYRLELGAGNEDLSELRAQGATRLAGAGKRAADRGDSSAAANLLQRATDLLNPSDPLRLEVGSEWATALIENGEYLRVEPLLDSLIDQARQLEDRRAEVYARLQLEESHIHSRPQVSSEEIRALSEKAIATFEELDDEAGQAYGLRLLAYANDSLGHSSEAQRAYERALQHAEASGDRARAIKYRRFLMQSISWGPIKADDLIVLANDYLRWALDNSELRSEAQAAGILSYAYAMKGDFEKAHAHSDRREAIYEELKLEILQAWTVFETSAINVLQGNLDEAHRQLRRACDICDRKEERAVFPTILGLLADVTFELGNFEEALALTLRAEQLGAHDDYLTQIKWRTARAKVLSSSGECESAVHLARDAVALAAQTEYTDWHANATTDLARVLGACGRPAEAQAALDDAVALYEAKGFTSGADIARSLMTSLQA